MGIVGMVSIPGAWVFFFSSSPAFGMRDGADSTGAL
jgi:hypothetical protein